MTAGWFQDRRLQFNDTISYQCASIVPHNPTVLQQPASEGSSSGKVVDFTDDGPSWSLLIVEWGSRDPDHSLSFDTSASSFLSVRHPKLTSSAKRRGEMRLQVSLLLTLLFLSGAGGGFRHPAPQGGEVPRF